MALSKALQTGQVPLFCQLCEDNIQIKWKCNCGIHQGQLCCLFCKECTEVVCPLCITKTHNKHNMIELCEGHSICVGMLDTFNRNLIEENMKLAADVSKLELIKHEQDSQNEKEKQKIMKKEKELIDAVKTMTKELTAKLDKERNDLIASAEKEHINSKEISNNLEFRSKQITSVLKSNNTVEVFKVVKREIQNRKQAIKSINIVLKTLPIFVPKETRSSDIGHFHGFFKDNMSNPTDMEFQVDQEFTTNLDAVLAVKYYNDGSIWLNDFSRIQNVSLESSSLIIKNTFELRVYDMTLTQSGELLLSTGAQYLQLWSPSTTTPQESGYNVSPLKTISVHVTKDNKVIVGGINNRLFFPVKDPCKVIVMDINGRQEVVYHLNTDNKPIFTFPLKITTDSKNNLYVIDQLTNDFQGRVVMLRWRGGVKGIYTGHSHKNEYPFSPGGIVATQSDNIIVSDVLNHALHILNTDGQCVKYQNTRDLGIMNPFSLEFKSQGMLFIGCSSKSWDKDKAKLYLVKIFGM